MAGMGLHYMAVIPGRHLSTIYREFSLNGSGGVTPAMQRRRRRDNKPSSKIDGRELMDEITKMFKADLSPDQISGRLKANYPAMPEKQASPSTVYKYLYQKTAEDPALKARFRQKHAKPRKRNGKKDGRGQITGRVSIDGRPKTVEEKSRVGDWEGDTIESAGKNAHIATFVDRKTKFLMAKVMPDKTAASLNKAAVRAFRGIPAEARNTLTPDNGKEFVAHMGLSQALSIDIFFAHPYHPWKRGLSEHTNGLIRQYLPKKVSFAALTQKQLDKIVAKINDRPRKVLGCLTLREAFSA
jgi:IS30 family transposase